jgi:hypothetical protein
VRAALLDGVGVRALVPNVRSVSFAQALGSPAPDRFYAIYAPTGNVEVFNVAGLDSLLRTDWVARW